MDDRRLDELLAPLATGTDITLYTIQTLAAWQHFQGIGRIKADGRRVWHCFRPAYRWMIDQLIKKVPGYPGVYPVWAWYGHKPDLRSSGHLNTGAAGVRITFTINSQLVLLSDFQAWHFVLNRSYFPTDEHDDDRYLQSRTNSSLWFNDMPSAEQQLVVKSWNRIFDLRLINGDKTNYIGPVDRIQACLASVPLQNILKIDHFTAR